MDKFLEEFTKKFREERHARNIKDDVYAEGYNSENNENPYPYPLELDRSMREISCKPERLTDEERFALKSLREQFEKTEWDRWSNGYYTRIREEEEK